MTSIADQYRIITSRAGWIDRSGRGRLLFTGADASSFLQALLTNDISTLQTNRGIYAAYLTPQGRMITDITVVNRGGGLLGLVPEGRGGELATRFDLLIFSEAVTVEDVTAGFAEIEVAGQSAAAVVGAAVGLDADSLASLPELAAVDFDGGFVLRDGASPFPMFRIFLALSPGAEAPGLQGEQGARIVRALEAAGAVAMSGEMATALRIEAGRGAWGHDLAEDVIPLEAGLLDRAISTSKGCYVGQEIVIRILHRGGGRVAKKLVVLVFDPAEAGPPVVKAPLEADGKPIGHLTSVAYSPAHERVIALGYVHRDAAEAGRRVNVSGVSGASGSTLSGVITGLAQ